MVLRRLELATERSELLYSSLYAAILISFVGVLYALYSVRKDILKAVEGSKQ